MRKPIIAGNWKMNKRLSEAKTFAESLIPLVKTINDCDIIIAPPFTYLSTLDDILKSSSISLSAQTMSHELAGAFTGDISAVMITDCGCKYVIIGHSEQRHYHQETNQSCQKKCKVAMQNKLTPIYCVGESLKERTNNITLTVIEKQILECITDLPLDSQEIIIAYEPVWAIGTGKVATPEEAQAVHQFIRQTIAKAKGAEIANKTRILYGGSVKPANIEELINQADIDGALVGGACLELDSFVELIKKTNYVTH